MNLYKIIQHLASMYGPRNAMFMRGEKRAMYLHRSMKSLQQAIRKNGDRKELGIILASVFARSVTYADSFSNLPLVQALCTKYPESGCAYCKKNPCICESNRTDQFQKIDSDQSKQLQWDITEWILHLDKLYGANNRERGIDKALLRLMEEMHEAESAHLFDPEDVNQSLEVLRWKISMEFADLFAWIFSISGMLEIDLQKHVEEQYRDGCKHCQRRICDCTNDRRFTTTGVNTRRV